MATRGQRSRSAFAE